MAAEADREGEPSDQEPEDTLSRVFAANLRRERLRQGKSMRGLAEKAGIGPGLGEVGATDNYTAVSDPGRAILSVLMLAGRLEVFTVLVLLTPAFWRPSTA